MISEALLKIVRRLFKRFGVDLIDANSPFELWDALQAYRDSNDSAGHQQEADFLEFLLRKWTISKSQLFQDIFVLQKTFEKSCGFFVDFGGTDGVVMSNSALLEFDFGWKGIVAEPARRWHESLFRNRSCSLDTRCVWHTSGLELEFNEAPECELSTIDSYTSADGHSDARVGGKKYTVESVSLSDLLDQHGAPDVIDYLSIDTEGSEFEILNSYDFSKRPIRLITVEHNFTPNRIRILNHLRSKGYVRVLEGFSKWDDWYVKVSH